MSTLVIKEGTQTCSVGTEHTVTDSATEVQTVSPYCFFDFTAAAAGDHFQVRIYEKTISGGTQIVVWTAEIFDTQSADDAALVLPPIPLIHGWKVTLKQVAGTSRNIPYSIRTP